ncbi:trypsin-like peptidase domain-containing protein [Streptomyces aquilus]|uniref:VMAP-C domain-containing protein n=1 Tax=Streptomyces aquilus TaxID=2548456 RepID=UPI0037D7184D
MTGAAWQARIERAGQIAGAGFLVTHDRVLTCAHVVPEENGGQAAVTVSFPQLPGSVPVPARVVARGAWGGHPSDLGDLAVLELAAEVSITPAALAPADTAHGDRKLIAYGFPRGYDEGQLAEYRTTGPVRVGGEWIQLEAWSGHGQPLVAGFSGAAVVLVETGEVVGMVTAAAGARDIRTGRMLPTDVFARHCAELEGLVPTAGRPLAARRRLRRLVEKAVRTGLVCDPVRLYADAADELDPAPPRGGFDSLWSAALFVQAELDDPDTVTRFADRLDALLHPPAAPPSGTGSTGPAWEPILVELRHSGAGEDHVQVEVSAYSGERRHPVASDTVPLAGLHGYLQDRIDAAFSHLTPGGDELIAFSLPRDWLDWPVDRWACAPGDAPLGCAYPVVVTDHTRRGRGTRHVLTRTWNRLGASTGQVHRVTCDSPEKPGELRLALRRNGTCLTGFAAVPDAALTREHFKNSLTAPAPVIVWSRRGCGGTGAGTDGCRDTCPGAAFLDALDTHVRHVPPAELPRHVLALRDEADSRDDHWARDIQLLWDDPRCFKDRHEGAAHVHTPVA